MPSDVLGDRVQAIIAGDEVVLARKLPLQPRLLFRVEFRSLDQIVDFVVQIRINELQLGLVSTSAVLIMGKECY